MRLAEGLRHEHAVFVGGSAEKAQQGGPEPEAEVVYAAHPEERQRCDVELHAGELHVVENLLQE